MLQNQVDAMIEQIKTGFQQLQQIAQENKLLREEITEIKQQLTIPQSA
jgi:cell division septum initiation protein DivIVA